MHAAGTLLPSLPAFGQAVAVQQCREDPPVPLAHGWPWGCAGQPCFQLAATCSGCGRSAAGRLLLGVVHCRREQGRRSQAGEEGRGLQWMGARICPWWGESRFSPAF